MATTKSTLASFGGAPVIAEEKSRPKMASPHDIEAAKLRMLEVRKALQDYETLRGIASSWEHKQLIQAFTKATEAYLRLSARQR